MYIFRGTAINVFFIISIMSNILDKMNSQMLAVLIFDSAAPPMMIHTDSAAQIESQHYVNISWIYLAAAIIIWWHVNLENNIIKKFDKRWKHR